MRWLSFSELSLLQRCEQAHDFRYVGQLTGGFALRPRQVTPRMREGTAWGVAVAALHETRELEAAHVALAQELGRQRTELEQAGALDPEQFEQSSRTLAAALDDYHRHGELLPDFGQRERRFAVRAPAVTRQGGRSNAYGYLCFVDGVCVDDHGDPWIVEFKWRGRLDPLEWVHRSPQLAWAVWAARETGLPVVGVVLDERLAEAPAPVALNKDGSPSARQRCRVDTYLDACAQTGTTPNPKTVDQLRQRVWQRRAWIRYTAAELEFAEQALAGLATRVGQLDRGQITPVRNASPYTCPGCLFREICMTPHDHELLDALFDRVEPKRQREGEFDGAPVR